MPIERARVVVSSALGGASVLLLATFLACEDAEIVESCRNIPAGGCPRSRGLACEDPACEAVYLCRPGNVWELESRCEAREAGVRTRVDASAEADARDALASFDASIDAPPGAFGGPACTSLISPDCALGVALSCGADCCGCEDLFVCETSGWTLWGRCEGGRLIEER